VRAGRRGDEELHSSTATLRIRPNELHCYPETASLYIELKPTPSTETREVADGLNVDLDEQGQVVGFDIDLGSKRLDQA
jgi:uncharacterized protein YuzE